MTRQEEQSAGNAGLIVAYEENPAPPVDSETLKNNLISIITDTSLSICQWSGGNILLTVRFIFFLINWIFAGCKNGYLNTLSYAKRWVRRFAVQNDIPLAEIKAKFVSLAERSREAAGESPFSYIWFWVIRFARAAARGLRTIFTNKDYLIPTAAACVFFAVVFQITQMRFGLEVQYNGETIGLIADESVYNRADIQMKGRIIYEDYIPPSDNIPSYSMVLTKPENLTTVNELTNRLIKASGNELSEAFGLYVDDAFQGAVTDKPQLDGLLDGLLDEHRTGDPTETVEFVQNVEIRSGLYPVTSVSSLDKLEQRATRLVEQQRIYTVQQGDAPTLIADRNNVPYADLKKLNPDIEKKLLVGQEVLLNQSVPLIAVKTMKEETYEESIPFEIQRTVDSSRAQGSINVVQTGSNGERQITAKVSYVDGVEIERVVLDTRTVKDPVTEKVIVGGRVDIPTSTTSVSNTTTTTTTTNAASGSFLWPVEGGGKVTCDFYGYVGHTGIDLGLRQGAIIRASASGTVRLAKYTSVNYGNYIIIDHGGNVQTLYAHNETLMVSPGEWVEQGQPIATMGHTGRAYGTHLHFEIRIGGRYMNPANYIGTTPY